jgi:biopolymer transport protein TolR
MPAKLRRRRVRFHEQDEAGELNIVPYLDIMVNLTMFMLMSITSLTALGIVNVTAPRYGGEEAASASTEPQKPQLLLTIGIAKNGFIIAGAEAVLPSAAPPPEGQAAAPTIPLKPDGKPDYAQLTEKAKAIKDAFPTETKVIIAADSAVPYEILVKTMDAVREHDGKRLFYDVTLSMM